MVECNPLFMEYLPESSHLKKTISRQYLYNVSDSALN